MFCFLFFLCFFFFQAEDGIRDVAVTGVQTCALPICGGWFVLVVGVVDVGVDVAVAVDVAVVIIGAGCCWWCAGVVSYYYCCCWLGHRLSNYNYGTLPDKNNLVR